MQNRHCLPANIRAYTSAYFQSVCRTHHESDLLANEYSYCETNQCSFLLTDKSPLCASHRQAYPLPDCKAHAESHVVPHRSANIGSHTISDGSAHAESHVESNRSAYLDSNSVSDGAAHQNPNILTERDSYTSALEVAYRCPYLAANGRANISAQLPSHTAALADANIKSNSTPKRSPDRSSFCWPNHGNTNTNATPLGDPYSTHCKPHSTALLDANESTHHNALCRAKCNSIFRAIRSPFFSAID